MADLRKQYLRAKAKAPLLVRHKETDWIQTFFARAPPIWQSAGQTVKTWIFLFFPAHVKSDHLLSLKPSNISSDFKHCRCTCLKSIRRRLEACGPLETRNTYFYV